MTHYYFLAIKSSIFGFRFRNHVYVKSQGVAQGIAPGEANARPPGLTMRAITSKLPEGGDGPSPELFDAL